ncbi:MAG: hypothetical protein ACLP72_17250 [Candidatus Sulfotelmatobacter sp.]
MLYAALRPNSCSGSADSNHRSRTAHSQHSERSSPESAAERRAQFYSSATNAASDTAACTCAAGAEREHPAHQRSEHPVPAEHPISGGHPISAERP